VNWTLQTYYDRTNHREPTFSELRNTLDVDLQRRASYGRHEVIGGLGYRLSTGTVQSSASLTFAPPRRSDQLASGFVRDEVSFLGERLTVALGAKFEHNDSSGFEIQPAAQALWAPTPKQSIWAAATRAVRTPSRVEQDLTITALVDLPAATQARLVGNPGFNSESVFTVQLGYRLQPASSLAFDAVAFHNDHSRLLSVVPLPPFVEASPPPTHVVFPLLLSNGTEGESYGAEVAVDWTPRSWWRVSGSYALLRLSLGAAPDSPDPTTPEQTNRSAPRHSFQLASRMDWGSRVSFDAMIRAVGALPELDTPHYWSVDARLAWRPSSALELGVVGQNLLAPHHAEFPDSGAQVPRGIYAELTWRK
jgi:iron complex outermembrane receptor protein